MKLLVASGNAKKLRELANILDELRIEGIELVSLHDVASYPQPAETGLTFRENALIKARAGAAATGLACVADDSGLSVAAMGGMPGVLSARWSGVHGDDEANNRLLLAQMADIHKRDAAFVCCCALVTPGGDAGNPVGSEFTTEGRWGGKLLTQPRGEGGFGYDPIFTPADLPPEQRGHSSAELTPEEKNARSHRGQALRALAPKIAALRTD